MKNRTYLVIELLTSFNAKEQEDFKHFISCNCFNSDDKIITLLKFLLKSIKQNMDSIEIQLVDIYNATFKLKKTKLNKKEKGAIYTKMHALLALSQQFLMIISLDKNKPIQTDLLQNELLDRKQFDVYNKYFIKTNNELVEKEQKGTNYYKHKYLLSIGNLTYLQLNGNAKQTSISNEIKINLTFYYLLNILKCHLNELSLKKYTSEYTDDSIFNTLAHLLELPIFRDNPLIKIYLAFIKLMVNEDDDVFLSLNKELLIRSDELFLENQLIFYNTLLNFCVFQMRKGKEEYKRKQFELLRIMDHKNLLLTDNQMHIGNLHNIVFASCNVNEYDWAVQMIEKYHTYLPINLRDFVKNYNLGVIAYHKRDYQLAIDYLFPLPTINLSHDINRRSLMIQAFYELDTDYEETTHTIFRSFEKYIREHKGITSVRKTSYKNFIRVLINLYRIKHNATKMKLENVRQKFEGLQFNSNNKSWLLEKIAELEP